ncbi:hypothetical protein [Burkholderia multivorans]|nr:hypothetical protein [Burkholderia multivorans]
MLIAAISEVMTLKPGDVIATRTGRQVVEEFDRISALERPMHRIGRSEHWQFFLRKRWMMRAVRTPLGAWQHRRRCSGRARMGSVCSLTLSRYPAASFRASPSQTRESGPSPISRMRPSSLNRKTHERAPLFAICM